MKQPKKKKRQCYINLNNTTWIDFFFLIKTTLLPPKIDLSTQYKLISYKNKEQ